MKIQKIEAIEIDLTPNPTTPARSPSRAGTTHMARPMSRYPDVDGGSRWKRAFCVVTAEDGTRGFGLTVHSGPVVRLINDLFAPALVGQDPMAIEILWDQMVRMTAPFGGTGLASYAISAVDTALWDLKGKLLERPVYELLGGPKKEKIFCYATGFDTEWYLELGFKATKFFTPWGPEAGVEGLQKNVEMVAQIRELIGDSVELMLDCWMAPDPEYAVRLIEALRPYRLKWIEEFVPADSTDGYRAVRQRVPWQTLASGEHWTLPRRFFQAACERHVDIFQPDVLWCGGITAAVKIAHIAEAADITVIPHASMNYPYGQHLVYALPAAVWGERSESVSAPGVPLTEMSLLPGTPAIDDGYLVPSSAPGFGLEIDDAWIESVTI